MARKDWISRIAQTIERQGSRGGFIVILPEYRPDLIQNLANELELHCFDYRREVMFSMGWDANRLGLDDLNIEIVRQAEKGGVIMNNVEALLSTKSETDARHWIGGFLQHDWKNVVLIPIVVSVHLTRVQHRRVHEIERTTLPKQTLVGRLSF